MNLQVIKNRVGKVLAYTFTAILFLIISCFLVLQMPPVQSYFVNKFLGNFTKVTGFKTTVQNFRMLWFDRLELINVSVDDPEGNRMIQAKEILINFKLTELLSNQNVNIDGVYVDSAHVFLTKIIEVDSLRDLNLNVFIANINDSYGGSGGAGKTPRINIGEAFVNQSQFTYVDQDRDTIRSGFDYNHFSLSVDEGQLNSFVILGDTTEFNLKTLIAQDLKTKFSVNQLSTFFRVCQTSMEFVGLNLQAGKSTIADTVIFKYKKLVDINDFVERVNMHANLINTTIDPNDLAYFAPGIEQVGQPILVNGIFNGRVNKFKLTNMKIDIGKTHLAGSIDMDGLPNISETFMIVNLNNSIVDPNDLAFLFNDNTMRRIRPLGRLVLDGQFLGYPNDFVAKGNFTSSLGGIKSDLNFKVNEDDIDRSSYSGNLSLNAFDLGTYLQDTATFQRVSMNGQILGTGLTQHTADFRLDGQVYTLGFKGYDYRNILTNARVASERFDGFLQIDDPNLKIKARGSIDLRDGRNIVNIQASLDTAFLHNLKLSKDSIFLRADFIADTRGLSLDSLEGIASFRNFEIGFNGEHLALESIQLDARRTNHQRSFILQTSLADVEVSGVYYLSDLYNNIRTLSKEISLNLQNNAAATTKYYKSKSEKPNAYTANITITLKDAKPLTKLFSLDMGVSPNTVVHGTFTSGYTTILQAYSNFDSLHYGDALFLNSQIDLTASKISDSTNVLGSFSLTSDNQQIGSTLKTKNLLVEGIWNKNRIDFGLDADQDGQTNYVRLKGAVNFLRDSTQIIMEPSALKLLEREWHFPDNNYLTIQDSNWKFHNMTLQNADQSISLNGLISKDPSRILSLNVNQLDLSLLNVLTKKKFKGVMNAQVDMNNYFGTPAIQNDLKISALTINDFLIGDITGKNQWDTLNHKFETNLFIDRGENRILNLVGEYDPNDLVSPIDLVAKLEKANLKIVEPFLEGLFSKIDGTVSGDFRITGSLDAPEVRGEGDIGDGQIMIDYLKTLYHFTGKIGLTSNTIYFKDIDLVDIYRNKAKLNGAITHTNFGNMGIGIDASFQAFQVLNTTTKDNTLFYGQAYATGEVAFRGLLENLQITASARTDKNTKIYIPVSGASSTEQKEFITFVNFTDTAATKKTAALIGKKKVNLTGTTFDLNLDVTPDAYCEIIFDAKAGDIIRGRGNGELKLTVDSKGDFQMFGPFEFTEGRYNFTLYDIVNKEFDIKPGSRINWLGDPYEGVMDIDASYNQLASVYPLLQTGSETPPDNPQLRRKYPIQVILLLDGPMLNPTINFDILAKDLPQYVSTDGAPNQNLDLAFTAFKSRLDEQELKRQVFSLIVLRRFSPPESFDTSGSVASSLSELLSNQLSYWMSQVDENLEIDVDVASMDQESFNTFQLRFSYTFLNGRLRVTGDGTYFNASQQSTAQSASNNVAGDWSVDYKLTADGKLRVKMYSRTNVNTLLASAGYQTYLTSGASIVHTQTFDELKDLFASSRKRRKKEQAASTTDTPKKDDGSD